MAWQNLAGLRRQLLLAGMFLRVCSKDDQRREPARTDAFEKALSLFRWDATKIEKLVLLDRCRRQYGPTLWSVLGKSPRYEPPYNTLAVSDDRRAADSYPSDANLHSGEREVSRLKPNAGGQPVAEVVRLAGWVYVTESISFGLFRMN
jgi:hypothetical protein